LRAAPVRPSNKLEYCPACFKPLNNRAAATSHYRRHARDGDLEEREGLWGRAWCLPNHAEKVWFSRGISYLYLPPDVRQEDYSQRREEWLRLQARNWLMIEALLPEPPLNAQQP
jgi:hypothetical protein